MAVAAAIVLSMLLPARAQDAPRRDPGPPHAEGGVERDGDRARDPGPPHVEGGRADRQRHRHADAWRNGAPETMPDAEQVKPMLEALKEAHPLLYRRLIHARERSPEHYRRGLAMAWRWYRRWSEMPENVRDESLRIQRLTVRIVRLTVDYRRAEDDDRRRELREEIEKLAGQRFDAEQKLAELRLAEMERKLDEMRERLERRENERDEVIERNVEAWLSGRMRDFAPGGWDGGPPERRRDRDAAPERGDEWHRREHPERERPRDDPPPEEGAPSPEAGRGAPPPRTRDRAASS